MTKELTAKQLAVELFKIHTHGDIVTGNEIVYREWQLIALLQKLGYPAPDFRGLTDEDFEDTL